MIRMYLFPWRKKFSAIPFSRNPVEVFLTFAKKNQKNDTNKKETFFVDASHFATVLDGANGQN